MVGVSSLQVAEAVLAGDETLLPEHTRRCQEKLPRLAWEGGA